MQDRSAAGSIAASAIGGGIGMNMNPIDHRGDYAESRTTGVVNRRSYEKSSSSSLRKNRRQGDATTSITATTPFIVLLTLLAVAMAIQFMIVISWHHKRHDEHVLGKRYDEQVVLNKVKVGRFDTRSALAETDDNVKAPVKKPNPVEAALAHQYRKPTNVSAKKAIPIYHHVDS